MLFDFQAFVNELRQNTEKKELIEKYEKLFWSIQWDIKDQIRFNEYVHLYSSVTYKIPEELSSDFDWWLLMQLVASSFSSEWLIQILEEDELPEFVISVQSWEQVVVKKISELRWFQILRLYEIYIEEQLNLQVLIAEDEKEKKAIEAQRQSKLNRWKLVVDNMDKDILKKVDSVEKEKKLDDLMWQL